MVTLADPTLKRLVEVNPAPDDLELPPISDVALFESILERARSEELGFRPVPVRVGSWRPGVVVAAAAFVAVLVVAGAIGVLSGVFSEREGPVVTEPPTVTTAATRAGSDHRTADRDDGCAGSDDRPPIRGDDQRPGRRVVHCVWFGGRRWCGVP